MPRSPRLAIFVPTTITTTTGIQTDYFTPASHARMGYLWEECYIVSSPDPTLCEGKRVWWLCSKYLGQLTTHTGTCAYQSDRSFSSVIWLANRKRHWLLYKFVSPTRRCWPIRSELCSCRPMHQVLAKPRKRPKVTRSFIPRRRWGLGTRLSAIIYITYGLFWKITCQEFKHDSEHSCVHGLKCKSAIVTGPSHTTKFRLSSTTLYIDFVQTVRHVGNLPHTSRD